MAATASVSVEPAHLSVAPGTTAVGVLQVRNEGPAGHRFRFEVQGDPAPWVSIRPFALSLGPGEEGTAQVFFRPPRSPSLPAGPHAVTIRIRADDDRSSDIEAAVAVEVEAFADLAAGLTRGEAPDMAAGDYRVAINNRGNTRARAAVSASDPTGRQTLTVDQPLVDLEPGRATDVLVRAAARRPAFGATRDLPFTIDVAPEGAPPISLEATVRTRPVVSRRLAAAIVAVTAIAVIAAVLRGVTSSHPGPAANRSVVVSSACPGAGHLAHDANGQIRHDVVAPDNFSFLFLGPGGCLPVRWNPCAPIHYVVNASATPAQLADTRQAVADIAQATGIDFTFDGSTTEDPRQRQPYEPSLYAGRWAPVIVEWAHVGPTTSLNEVAGGGYPAEVGGVYVSGSVFLNADAVLAGNAPLPDGFGPGVTWGRILLHELGHVLGLGHVNGVEQVMHDPVTEQTSPTSAYGVGDLTGLRFLGRSAGCLASPPVPGPGN